MRNHSSLKFIDLSLFSHQRIFIKLSEEIFDSEVILCLSNLQGGHSLQRSHDDQIDFLPKSEKDHFNI